MNILSRYCTVEEILYSLTGMSVSTHMSGARGPSSLCLRYVIVEHLALVPLGVLARVILVDIYEN